MTARLIGFLSLTILLAVLQTNKAAFFRRTKVLGRNACLITTRSNKPIRAWPFAENLTSAPITKELKECSFFCHQNLNCLAYQVVRLADGRGFCHIFQQFSTMYDVGADTCKSFVKTEKQLDCVIRWNPINYQTINNMEGFRVEKADKSWSIYNNSRGIHIIGLNSTTCQPYSHNVFDTVASASERTRFTTSSNSKVSTGSFLIGYSVGGFFDLSLMDYLQNTYSVIYGTSCSNSLAFICVKGTSAYCRKQEAYVPDGYTVFVFAEVKDSPFVVLAKDTGSFMGMYRMVLLK